MRAETDSDFFAGSLRILRESSVCRLVEIGGFALRVDQLAGPPQLGGRAAGNATMTPEESANLLVVLRQGVQNQPVPFLCHPAAAGDVRKEHVPVKRQL